VTAVLPVWWDGPADGPTNMAADELLAAEAELRGVPVVRVYAWAEPTVSLGAFQPLAEAVACAAIAGLPIVRRPSGGGAIIHGTDLTYAVAVPRAHAWGGSPQVLYDAMHESMAATLRDVGIAARLHVPSGDDPPADAFLCFRRRSPGDLVVSPPGRSPRGDDPKVMGSAQRRLGTAVIQHGSLLFSPNPAVGPEAREGGLDAFIPAGRSLGIREIAQSWLSRVASVLGAGLHHEARSLTKSSAAALAERRCRFTDPTWTARR
jgi:lipoyl(octanoyl) transferase